MEKAKNWVESGVEGSPQVHPTLIKSSLVMTEVTNRMSAKIQTGEERLGGKRSAQVQSDARETFHSLGLKMKDVNILITMFSCF